MPLLSALILATLAAGLWAWLCAPAAQAAQTVAAPRLLATAAAPAETVESTDVVENVAHVEPAGADVATPVAPAVPAPLIGTVPGVAGSRAPPAAR